MPTPALNNVYSTLSAGIGAGDSTITVADASRFPSAGWVTIGGGVDQFTNEVVSYTGKSGNSLTGCVRGRDGTTAEPHGSGAFVGIAIIARHISELQVSHGTTLERETLGMAYTLDEIGKRFWDTDLQELFIWMGTNWAIPVISVGSNRGVTDYVVSNPSERAAVLAGNYRKGDRMTDLTTIACRVYVCKADPITNSLNDWVAIGRQL